MENLTQRHNNVKKGLLSDPQKPTQKEIDSIENFKSIIGKIICELAKDTLLLCCLRQITTEKDSLFECLPQTAIDFINSIPSIQTADTNYFLPSSRPFLKSYSAVVNDVLHQIREYQLVNEIIGNHCLQLRRSEIEYIQYLFRFKKTWQNRMLRNCRDDTSVEMLKPDNLGNQEKPVKFLKKENECFKKTTEMEAANRICNEEAKGMRIPARLLRNKQAIEMKHCRQHHMYHFVKLANSLNENPELSAETLHKKRQLYETTLLENQKKLRQLKETAFKRQAAVLQIIEKFDRDLSTEHKKLRTLIDKQLELDEKSKQLDETLSTFTMENRHIIEMNEKEKKIAAIIKIQRWWREKFNKINMARILNYKNQQKDKKKTKKKGGKKK